MRTIEMLAVTTALVLGAAPERVSATQTPSAQVRPAPPTTYEAYVATVWKAVHGKVLSMAKDLPEDRYGWKPHPDSRSMLAEFRHVVIGLDASSAELRGEKFDYAALVTTLESIVTRDAIVAEMERALAASYLLVDAGPKPRLVWWLEHQAEHYGKLVSNYRASGLVPPTSRPR